jgi:L-asparaginase/Glu-tRNA(Gln) amidotransferase subunit D
MERVMRGMKETMDLGVPGFKVFMIYRHQGWMADDWSLFQVMRRARELGGIVTIHAENGFIGEGLQEEFVRMYDGVVIEGTGLGHIRTDDKFINIVESYGRPVVITTQCLHGGEKLGIYALDKKILGIKNIIPTGDMLPETALVKLMWSMAQGGDVRSLMLSNIAGEITRT